MLVLGYFRLDRPGDFDTEETTKWGEGSPAECEECGQPIRGLPWLAVTMDEGGLLHLVGPLCGVCASSE